MGSLARAPNLESASEADRELVLRARDGDRDAFAEIVRIHQKRIYRVAMRMTRRHDVADDVTQETFIRAYRNLGGFELGRPLTPWLTRIAVNLCINHLNGSARREVPLGPEERREDGGPFPESLDTDPHRHLESKEFAEDLDRAIQNLSPDHRAVFLLKVVEGMRYEEIAQALEITEGTVMSRLSRARARLKQLLAEHVRKAGGSDAS